jgi:hypothetical protein
MGIVIAGLLAAVLGQDAPQNASARAVAEMLAGCVHLYEDYTGREAASLAELTKPAADIAFWPEGGFLLGALPKDPWGGEYRIADRTIACSKPDISVPLAPAGHTRIAPPEGRLRQCYTARLQVQLVSLAARAFLASNGKLPERAEDLGPIPKDPWGGDYHFDIDKDTLVIRPADADKIAFDLTKEEEAALAKAATVELTADEKKSIADALDRATDDDLAVREEANALLLRYGKRVRGLIKERLAAEKDRHAKRWLGQLDREIPDQPDSWKAQCGHIFGSVLSKHGQTLLDQCKINLTTLWRMATISSLMTGGGFPTETGGDFWLAIPKANRAARLIQADSLQFQCPGAKQGPAGTTTYRGPATDVNNCKDDATPIGMCDHECHGGLVIIIRKGNDDEVYPRCGPLWKEASEKTKK